MKGFAYTLILAAVFASCDYVDEPIDPGTVGGGNGDSTVLRNALLEEFTGHRCSTCPAAHVVTQQLSTFYGERLVVVGIHATNTFGSPLDPPAADGRYSSDYRTPAGNTYTSTFGVSFLPTGMVSRTERNNSITIAQGAWGSAISDILDQPALFRIQFDQLEVNSGNNSLNASIRLRNEAAIDADHKLVIYMVEDHIIDWQLNGTANPPDVPDYEHRHVFRGAVNGTWGEDAVAAGTAAGDTTSIAVNGFPLATEWNLANCYLVAYLYNTSTNEVMQVAQRKIQP